jgi:hypothetical protein
LIVAAQQLITMDWWDTAHLHYKLFVSEAVLNECRAGDPEISEKRIAIIQNLSVLAISDKVVSLAIIYQSVLAIPEKSRIDSLHLAYAVVYEMDYLLTWNCKHLAHGEVRTRLHRYNQTHGLFEPMIVTPQELMERD